MDLLFDFLLNTLCYKVGLWVMKVITFGRFKGKSSYWFGFILMLGGLVVLAVLIGFITLLVMINAHSPAQ
ncbi:hypothetical protein ALQ04_00929 [Pseudomonas cichorii]|uniref:Uncharacterized protein n=1 Tax=Pseudomonas cichorii TaxID=36746 RepID=A0A3M4LI24_PSECI|nr:hypothetical protein [Pseudomonas cichorii]RMQ40804.1 hypothetical protein ALQ04_00929 [Pseudomonas cichorii]